MAPVADASGSFAEVLRCAIDARGLGLERIRDHLDDRGVSVSVATLSYWRSGRSQPERRSSLAALPHLEAVLRLEPGALRAALPAAGGRRRRCAPADLDSLWPEQPHLRVLAALDTRWDTELDRVSLHDVLTIGPDRTVASLLVRQVLRARVDGPDRRVVLHCADDPEAALPALRPLAGFRPGRTVSDGKAGVLGTELVFHRPLRRGETVLLEYELVHRVPGPREVEYSRRVRMPMREYLLELRFDPAAAPTACEAFGACGSRPLEVDPAGRVHLVEVDCRPAVHGIRWSWPATRAELGS